MPKVQQAREVSQGLLVLRAKSVLKEPKVRVGHRDQLARQASEVKQDYRGHLDLLAPLVLRVLPQLRPRLNCRCARSQV